MTWDMPCYTAGKTALLLKAVLYFWPPELNVKQTCSQRASLSQTKCWRTTRDIHRSIFADAADILRSWLSWGWNRLIKITAPTLLLFIEWIKQGELPFPIRRAGRTLRRQQFHLRAPAKKDSPRRQPEAARQRNPITADVRYTPPWTSWLYHTSRQKSRV